MKSRNLKPLYIFEKKGMPEVAEMTLRLKGATMDDMKYIMKLIDMYLDAGEEPEIKSRQKYKRPSAMKMDMSDLELINIDVDTLIPDIVYVDGVEMIEVKANANFKLMSNTPAFVYNRPYVYQTLMAAMARDLNINVSPEFFNNPKLVNYDTPVDVHDQNDSI